MLEEHLARFTTDLTIARPTASQPLPPFNSINHRNENQVISRSAVASHGTLEEQQRKPS